LGRVAIITIQILDPLPAPVRAAAMAAGRARLRCAGPSCGMTGLAHRHGGGAAIR